MPSNGENNPGKGTGQLSRREFLTFVAAVSEAYIASKCVPPPEAHGAAVYTPTGDDDKIIPTPTSNQIDNDIPKELEYNLIGELPFGLMGVEKIGNPPEMTLVGNLIMTDPKHPIYQFADNGKITGPTTERLQKEQLDKDRALFKTTGESILKAKIFDVAGGKYRERKFDLSKTTAFVFRYQEEGKQGYTNFVIIEEKTEDIELNNYYYGFALDSNGYLVPPKDGQVSVFYPLVRSQDQNQSILGIAGVSGEMLVPLFGLNNNESNTQYTWLPPFKDVKAQEQKTVAAYPSNNIERMLENRPDLNFILESQLPAGSRYEIADFKGEKTWVIKGPDGITRYVYSPYYESFVDYVNPQGMTQVNWSEAHGRGVTKIPVFNTERTAAVDFQPDAIYKNTDGELLFVDKFGTEVARLDKEGRLMVTSYRNGDYLPLSIECEQMMPGKFENVVKLPSEAGLEEMVTRPVLVSIVQGENDSQIMTANQNDNYVQDPEKAKIAYNFYHDKVLSSWVGSIHDPNLRLILATIVSLEEINIIPRKLGILNPNTGDDWIKYMNRYNSEFLNQFMPQLEKTTINLNNQNPEAFKNLNFDGKSFKRIRLQFISPEANGNPATWSISVNDHNELIIRGNFPKPKNDWVNRLGWVIPRNIIETIQYKTIINSRDKSLYKLNDQELMNNHLINLLTIALDRLLMKQDGYPIFSGVTTN